VRAGGCSGLGACRDVCSLEKPLAKVASVYTFRVSAIVLGVFEHGLFDRGAFGGSLAFFGSFDDGSNAGVHANASLRVMSQTIYKAESQLQNRHEDVHHD
jgi:hypothetical protein